MSAQRLSVRRRQWRDSVEVVTRYRLDVEGVRVAIMTHASVWDSGESEIEIDFWTPKTRWGDGSKISLQGWKEPVKAFSTISKEIEALYREHAEQGYKVVVFAACEKRLKIYFRCAMRATRDFPDMLWRRLVRDDGCKGFIIFPYG
jgi:hypothetical protein